MANKKTVKKPVKDTVVEEKLQKQIEQKEEEILNESMPEEEPVELELGCGMPEAHGINEQEFSEEEEEIDPVKIIEEFSEGSKKLDEKVTSKLTNGELEQVLSDELTRVEEIEEKLQKQIEQKEESVSKFKFNDFWNGVSTGWFD